MKQLFINLYLSITEPKSYRTIIHKTTLQSFGYFFFYYAIIILVVAFYVTLFIAPEALKQTSAMFQDFSDQFPKSARLQFQETQLSLSGTDQFTISLSSRQPNLPTHLLIIDPDSNAEDITSKDTLILATDETLSFITNPETNDYLIIPWQQLNLNTTLDQNHAQQIALSGRQMLDTITPFIFPLTVMAGLVILIPSRLLFVVIYSIFFHLAGNLSNRNYGYSAYLKIGLHTVVIAQLIDLLQRLIYPNPWPMLFSVAYIGITTIALISLPPQPKMLKA